jgi:polar amino acid transport system ATP-binding protein/putative ABC transport system ATP-binding protein
MYLHLDLINMIEINNLTLSLGGKDLFHGVSFALDKGETACIMGASGSGKTSLLRAILGFIPIADGTITIDGEMITPLSAETFRQDISYLPQELALPCETVCEMVQMPFTLKVNKNKTFSKKAMMEEWGKLDIAPSLYDKKVSEISGGQRQRMMLAVSGLLDKSLLLLDEPTSALDTSTAQLVSRYVCALAAKGTIVLAVSHSNEFASCCNKIIKLDNGNY